MSLIEDNFSNYSAWHQRSKLLPLIFTDRSEFVTAITEELDIVQNAFYTVPNDSSAWFYHRWLVAQNPTPEILNRELTRCEELLGVVEADSEKKCGVFFVRYTFFDTSLTLNIYSKGPKLTMVFLLKQLPGNEERIKQLLEELTAEDPSRKNYYTYLLDSAFK
jgi:geranylgeranyl transferase type-2 subunit alpha